MNATDIINALEAHGVKAEWENTGGGVYNVVAYVTGGTVCVSENGEWTEGDEDSEVGFDGVTVIGYDTEGDSICDERINDNDIWAMNLAEVIALYTEMAEAVTETHINRKA